MMGHGVLAAALAARAHDGAPTVLAAPPGRGKSTLLAAVAEPWLADGGHVVWLTAAPTDRTVPYAAIADLLADAPELPDAWREAVHQALRLAPGEPDPVALRLAARACLDAATPAGKRALVLADDTQWWDPASLDLLAYLARHGTPVLAATRNGGPADFLGRDALELAVPPLSREETAAILQDRAIGYRVAARVHAAAGGNARLTVEIARGLDEAADALDVVTIPTAARRCVRAWIDELPSPDAVWRTLLIAALAADATVPTLRRTAGPDTLEALSRAEQAGLIAVDMHGTASFPASAVRETVLADASQETIRTAHLLLAATATDATDRLWHRASAARDRPDAEVATELAIAARAVQRRGEPGRAAELWLLAAEMMPARDVLKVRPATDAPVRRPGSDADDPLRAADGPLRQPGSGAADPLPAADGPLRQPRSAATGPLPAADGPLRQPRSAADNPLRAADEASPGKTPLLGEHAAPPSTAQPSRPAAVSALLLAAATDAASAGRHDLARTAVARLDRSEADRAVRARARLAVVDAAGQALAGLDDILARALADAEAADDPALLSAVHLRVAWQAHLALGRNRRAHDAARAAVRCAELSQDPESRAVALAMLARIEQLRGQPAHPRILRRALDLAPDPVPGALINSPRWLAVRFALFDDRLDEAAHHLRQLTSYAERSGSRGDQAILLRGAVEIDARAGRGAAAVRNARRLAELPGAERASPGPVWFTAALAESAGGTLAEALRLAERGSAASTQEGDQIFLTRCLALSGTIRLLLRETAAAAEDLRRVRAMENDQGIRDPATIRYHADLIEALTAQGQLAEATDVLSETRHAAERLHRRGVLASLDRAEAVLKAAQGDHARAEALLRRADHTFSTLGLPLERGRVLLTRAMLEKRQRRVANARTLHGQAETVFRRAQAPLWEPAAKAPEPAATTPAPDLTAAEQRVVTLVAEGLPNREIAATLFLSIKTVEAVLTGVYRKLGVRSRTQLAVLLRDD
ncbi:helix-turn-helix transcriptional regulator [Catenulispora subtropica]|uniref:HTH luxR-type domain-containing protein n=1 Tax=Catenulispora subtropica TaxID=450798 RepID=A0ABN2QIX6_9ACTN